jgi:hypothetical protein
MDMGQWALAQEAEVPVLEAPAVEVRAVDRVELAPVEAGRAEVRQRLACGLELAAAPARP